MVRLPIRAAGEHMHLVAEPREPVRFHVSLGPDLTFRRLRRIFLGYKTNSQTGMDDQHYATIVKNARWKRFSRVCALTELDRVEPGVDALVGQRLRVCARLAAPTMRSARRMWRMRDENTALRRIKEPRHEVHQRCLSGPAAPTTVRVSPVRTSREMVSKNGSLGV